MFFLSATDHMLETIHTDQFEEYDLLIYYFEMSFSKEMTSVAL